VSWKGYPVEENEWIIGSNLTNATDAIKAFHRSHPTAPRPQKTLRLRYSAEIPDSPCICPICQNIPIPPPSGLSTDPDFLAFHKQYQGYPNEMFGFPTATEVWR